LWVDGRAAPCVNLPIGVLAGGLGLRLLAADRGAGLQAGAGGLGAILVTVGLMTGLYSLVGTARYGWPSVHPLAFAAVAVVLIGAFVARQATAARPLLALRTCSSRNVSGANLTQGLVIAAACSPGLASSWRRWRSPSRSGPAWRSERSSWRRWSCAQAGAWSPPHPGGPQSRPVGVDIAATLPLPAQVEQRRRHGVPRR
jgi:hypothetical protein